MNNFDSLRVPKYVQLMFQLREAIEDGTLKPGDPLPTREKLMRENDLSLSTVTRAITELERQGWLVSRQGSGTFVVKRTNEGPSSGKEAFLVGLMVPNKFALSEKLVQELVDECNEHDIHLLVNYCPEEEEAELNMARALLEKELKAMIWFPVQPKKHVSVASLFGKNKIPVIIGEHVTDDISSPWSCVRSDYYGGTKSALEMLISQGHKNIAYIGPKGTESDFGPIHERWNAYKDVMKEHNLWEPDERVINPSLFREWHVNLNHLESIFRRRNAPTAIVGYDDIIVLEAIRGLKAIGVNIPNDIEVIGHGNSEAGCYSEPRLSTVSTCAPELADAIVRMLRQELKLIDEPVYESREVVIPQRILLRDTTKTRDEVIAAG